MSEATTFRILSLDGGGIRGAFTAGFLAELERRLGRPVAQCFDLLAGTSTGGIIATGLALDEPATRIEEFYLNHGPGIFRRSGRATPWWVRPCLWGLRRCSSRLDAAWLWQSKYRTGPLAAALTEVFGNRTLETAGRRLVVPAVDLARGQTVVFKTPHLPGMDRDRHLRAVDVVLATTAAPAYFPPTVIGLGSAYCDGGLWANNPAVVAIVEAMRIQRECTRPGQDRPFGVGDIRVLSVGTGEHPYFIHPKPTSEPGLLFWGPQLLEVIGASQSQGIGFLADHLLGNGRCRRVNFPIQDRSWKLDAVEMLDRLVHIGREVAIARLDELKGSFLSSPAPAYAPFPQAQARHA